jgi:hypothetical protein
MVSVQDDKTNRPPGQFDSTVRLIPILTHLIFKKDSTFKSRVPNPKSLSEGQILGRNWDKSLRSFPSLLFTVTSTYGFYYPPPPPSKSGLKLVVCNANIVNGNLKCEKELPRLCPETSTKSSVYEFGFRSDYTMTGYGSPSKLTQ